MLSKPHNTIVSEMLIIFRGDKEFSSKLYNQLTQVQRNSNIANWNPAIKECINYKTGRVLQDS